tara:strand:- start:57319 stop:58728 length:1410 start_codon:yes stop_codon:yes gene_type:complete
MKIQFFGATQEVTGSCFLIQTQSYKILVDCGLLQGSHTKEQKNFEAFPFDVNEINAVLLTHAHIDHSGKLPLLIKAGFKGKIYTHHATKDLCNIMLQDAGFLNEKDVEIENRKRERRGQELLSPLYTVQDAIQTMSYFETLGYGIKQEIIRNISIKLSDAGHILGSAIIEVWLSEGGVTRKVVFSGDLGRKDMPILRDPSIIKNADLVLMESTYGDRGLPRWEENLKQFSDIILEARQSKGNILIPSFAVGRSQEILYSFYDNFNTLNLNNSLIFLDSPMAIKVTEVYAKHWNLYDKAARNIVKTSGSPYKLPNLRLCVDTADSMGINQIKQGAIIIAGSGMCNGGRIRHHLKHNIWRKQCHLIFVGYQAESTLGRRILEGAKEINLWGEQIQVSAKVHMVNGFSAHADQTGLLNWYGHFNNLPPLILVHGEINAMNNLAQEIYNRYTVHPWIPKYKDEYDLIKRKPIH